MSSYVVSQGSHDSDLFDPIKLHESIISACMAVRTFEGEAHDIAEHVCKSVIDWLEQKTEVTSYDIKRVTSDSLRIYHPEAAYMYEQQGLIL